MKKVLGFLAVITILIFTACSGSGGGGNDEKLVGIWINDDGRFIYVFNEDNTGVFYYREINHDKETGFQLENEWHFEWTIDKDVLCADNDCDTFRLSGNILYWEGRRFERMNVLPDM